MEKEKTEGVLEALANKLKPFLFGSEEKSEEKKEEKVELATAKLESGVVVEFDELEVGESLFVVDGENRIPAPEGEHILEDGRKIVVEEEGVIASIAGAEAEETEAGKEEELAVKMADMEERLAKCEERLASYEEMKSSKEETEEKLSKETKRADEAEKKLVELAEEAAAEPDKVAPSTELSAESKFDQKEFNKLKGASQKAAYLTKHPR